MEKHQKLLIAEFADITDEFSKEELNSFFQNKEYKSLKSYRSEDDAKLLYEFSGYHSFLVSNELDCSEPTQNINNKSFSYPKVFVTIFVTDESLNLIQNIIRVPYLKNSNLDELIKYELIKVGITDDHIIQFNSTIDNKYNSEHEIDLLYYVYNFNFENMKPIFEFDVRSLDDKYKKTFLKYIDSLLSNTFDKDIKNKIKKIRNGIAND